MRSRSPAVRATRDAAINNFLLVPVSALVVLVLAYMSLDRTPVDVLSHVYRTTRIEAVVPMEVFWPLLHFSIYVALAFCGYQVLRRSVTQLGVFALVVALGMVLEIAQAFTGTRAFELADIMANVLGAGTGILLVYRVERRRLAL